MAENPQTTLTFNGGCPDCAERQVQLPPALPEVGDDFDWLVRDYDSFRRFMLEELAARFPERTRWTPADMEVVLVEVLAALLDQLSDMLDRVATESYLETARRPETVRRLLALIGFDAATAAGLTDEDPDTSNAQSKEQQLEKLWRQSPATAWEEWSGSWTALRVAAVLWQEHRLDDQGFVFPEDLKGQVEAFHRLNLLSEPVWQPDLPTIRTVLRPYLDALRMIGQEVFLQDAEPVSIKMFISIQVAENFFQSEVRHAVNQGLGTAPGGFFEPGRLDFGEDLYASDIFQTLMALDGVENVCLNRFKRLGDQFPDQADTGVIPLQGLDIAICDNDPTRPERGFFNLKLSGGRRG
jgi:hypothetical protein